MFTTNGRNLGENYYSSDNVLFPDFSNNQTKTNNLGNPYVNWKCLNIYCLDCIFYFNFFIKLFLWRGPYHIQSGSLMCTGNQWTGFYMIGTSVMKQL